MTFDDFSAPDSITVGGVACTPMNAGYESGNTIVCETGAGLPEGAQDLVVTLQRDSGGISRSPSEQFMVVRPTLISVVPDFGPRAGGSELRVSGSGLDIGNSVRVFLDGATECRIM